MRQIVLLQPNVDTKQFGLLPYFLNSGDEDSAREQFDKNYAHGGGWQPFDGFKMDMRNHSIKYDGDPRMMPLATMTLRSEQIYFYESAWVAIVQPDGSFEVARMD